MGHNCVEGPDTPAVAASRCREQMNSTRGRSGWCHRTPLLCPTSAGSLTNQSSGRKLAAGARSPAGPVKISLPGSRRHFSSADTIWQRRVTWPRDMSWRHRVTCRDVTRHSICHKSTHYPPPWPRPTRADRLTEGSKLYRDLSPQLRGTRDPRPGRVGGGTHGGFGSAHVETGHIFDFPVRWHNTWWSITASYLDRGIPSHNHTAGR